MELPVSRAVCLPIVPSHTLLTWDVMHLFVRSCGADNIFIVLINLQERYLIVGRFLFTSPLTPQRLIAPRPLFESENWMLFIIQRDEDACRFYLCGACVFAYDLCGYKDVITVTRNRV